MAMGKAYREEVAGHTLQAFSHAPYTKTPSPPGMPPARISGELAGSVREEPGVSSAMTGRASVAPHTVYARIQETGGDIYAHGKYMKFVTDYPTRATSFRKSQREGGGLFLNFARHVHIPARPYMRPTTARMVANGSLHRVAAAEFTAKVWG